MMTLQTLPLANTLANINELIGFAFFFAVGFIVVTAVMKLSEIAKNTRPKDEEKFEHYPGFGEASKAKKKDPYNPDVGDLYRSIKKRISGK